MSLQYARDRERSASRRPLRSFPVFSMVKNSSPVQGSDRKSTTTSSSAPTPASTSTVSSRLAQLEIMMTGMEKNIITGIEERFYHLEKTVTHLKGKFDIFENA